MVFSALHRLQRDTYTSPSSCRVQVQKERSRSGSNEERHDISRVIKNAYYTYQMTETRRVFASLVIPPREPCPLAR